MPAALGCVYCVLLCRALPPAGGGKAIKVEAVIKYGFTGKTALIGGENVLHEYSFHGP